MFEKYYTPKQVAEILQIHQYTVLKWIRDGKIKALKFGRVYRATESDIAEFLGTSRSQNRRAKEESVADETQPLATSSVTAATVTATSTAPSFTRQEEKIDHFVL